MQLNPVSTPRNGLADPSLAPREPDRLRVLAIDDDPEHVALVERMMSTLGFEVDGCATLGQAAVMMGLGRYVLVLADWRLGAGDSGLDLAALMPRFQPDAAFAVMTSAGREALERAVGGAALPVLEKPFDREACRSFVRDLFAQNHGPP